MATKTFPSNPLPSRAAATLLEPGGVSPRLVRQRPSFRNPLSSAAQRRHSWSLQNAPLRGWEESLSKKTQCMVGRIDSSVYDEAGVDF